MLTVNCLAKLRMIGFWKLERQTGHISLPDYSEPKTFLAGGRNKVPALSPPQIAREVIFVVNPPPRAISRYF
jgi:hypothetical protein